MARKLTLAAILVLWAGSVAADTVPQRYELRDGKWIAVPVPSTQVTAADAVDPVLNSIEDRIAAKQCRQAVKQSYKWLKAHGGSPQFDRGLYLCASALYCMGDRIRAFYYLDELLDFYPESSYYQPALQMQYDIANAFLNGYKRRFLLIPFLSANDEAIDMLYRVQQRAPGSEIAEKSLLRTGDYFYKDGQFDISADVYAAFVKSFPRSPLVPRVKLREAFSNLAQYNGPRFDPTPVIDARTQLLDIAAQYPDLAAQENIPTILKRIDVTFARKLAYTADFYQRTRQPKAAAYVYEFLSLNYPNTTEAETARRRLQSLPKPVVSPATPATQPLSAVTQ